MRKFLLAAITLSLLIPTGMSASNAAVKAGAACSKLNSIATSSGKKFTCIKSGKKMVWNAGTNIGSKSTSKTSDEQTPKISSASLFLPSTECQLLKPINLPMDDGPFGSIGFPRDGSSMKSLGDQRGLVIFVDFPDVIAPSDLKSAWEKSSIPLAESLFRFASYGKFKLKVDMTKKVYRIQKNSEYYALKEAPSGGPIPGAPAPKLDEVIADAMVLADADIDFSKYLFVTVASPANSNLTISGASGLGPNPKQFDGVSYSKASFQSLDSLTPLDKPYKTLNFTHDIGHMLGLMHPYVDRSSTHGAWDIMWNFAYQNDFLGWNKWKLEWIEMDQVSCISPTQEGEVISLLTPIGDPSNKAKMMVIKLNLTKALVVEVRRKTPFEKLSTAQEGVIVYTVDATKGQGDGPIEIVSNPNKIIDSQNFAVVLGTMRKGDSTISNGYEIKVLHSNSAGDYVSIKKSA